MKIIAQKSNSLNTRDFFTNALSEDYIDAISFNITYTNDDKIVIFNDNSAEIAITNTINTSTLNELEGYEIILLDEVLNALSKLSIKKNLYINLAPIDTGILNDENIQENTAKMYSYIDELKSIIDKYKDLNVNLHSTSRRLITILKQKIKNLKIGFAVSGNDFNFIDVDYYVLSSNTQNDYIIDVLLKNKKEVIIYVYSEYYISYIYEHYLGSKSTPKLNELFKQLNFMTRYPKIIYKMFEV